MTWTELKLKPYGIVASWKIARPASLSPILDRLSWSNKKKRIWDSKSGWRAGIDLSCAIEIAAMRTLISLHCGVDNKFWWRIGRFDWTRNNWWAKEDSSGICILGWIWSTSLEIIEILTMEQGILTTNNKNFDIKIFAVWKKFSNKISNKISKQIQILAWNYFWSKKKKREKEKFVPRRWIDWSDNWTDNLYEWVMGRRSSRFERILLRGSNSGIIINRRLTFSTSPFLTRIIRYIRD